MKLSLTLFLAASAQDLADQRCVDYNLGQRCKSECNGALFTCESACDPNDYTCQTRCQSTHLDCTNTCPCGPACPLGCSSSDGCALNSFCSYRSVLLINHECVAAAFVINTEDDSVKGAAFDYNVLDIEDSCSVVFRGEALIIGGYQRPRQISKLNESGTCGISHMLLVPSRFKSSKRPKMKLSMTFFLAASAQDLADQRCVDYNLGQRCKSECNGALFTCDSACDPDDYTCQTRCQSTHLDCTNTCPCGPACPLGCSSSDGCALNSFCSYRSVLLINHEWVAAAFVINTEDDSVKGAAFDYNVLDIEDSCSVVFRGEAWIIGGYQRPRQISKLNESGTCGITHMNEILTVEHMDGMYGSCGVFDGAVALCFYENSDDNKACWTYQPGEEQTQLPSSSFGHDWAEMVTFKNELVTVGGCDSTLVNNCNSNTEVLYTGSDSWVTKAPAPFSGYIRGHTMTADGAAVYLMGGRTVTGTQKNVLMYKDNVWSTLGALNETGATISSAFQFGYNWYVGNCAIERTTYEDGSFNTTTIYGGNGGCSLDLYYAHFVEIPTGTCAT
ncbi:Oidioi.mRNA.OKI2018_I69.chr2.g4540.t1.cds [Oikopleura dioica]|uniref:Oidioi.mRNA.OKI2018_I69.chr2.g4540.t1.cds n=1 Tax=Oikopleura dioica TaxID=34765 RepID=A0ABN7T6R3_OIKDI|nr:Oidioi.mRNA.OKI2018_I69.chr2.g4540.t1.cds [Oikopleura dioica]